MTDKGVIRTSEAVELQQLRELVRHIAAEDEPSRLKMLFAQLRTLVGVSPDEPDPPSVPDLTRPSLLQPAPEE
jgi:hypothetical protein